MVRNYVEYCWKRVVSESPDDATWGIICCPGVVFPLFRGMAMEDKAEKSRREKKKKKKTRTQNFRVPLQQKGVGK